MRITFGSHVACRNGFWTFWSIHNVEKIFQTKTISEETLLLLKRTFKVKIGILEIGFNLAQMPFKSLPRVHPVIEIVDFMFFMPAAPQAAFGA